jgi:hypothetical protein
MYLPSRQIHLADTFVSDHKVTRFKGQTITSRLESDYVLIEAAEIEEAAVGDIPTLVGRGRSINANERGRGAFQPQQISSTPYLKRATTDTPKDIVCYACGEEPGHRSNVCPNTKSVSCMSTHDVSLFISEIHDFQSNRDDDLPQLHIFLSTAHHDAIPRVLLLDTQASIHIVCSALCMGYSTW